jgi:hypothetical protein
MSYRLIKTLQYGVAPPQAFAIAYAQLPTAFPLESAVAAKVSRARVIPKSGIRFSDKMIAKKGPTLKIARPWNTLRKVPPGEAAHLFSAGKRKLFLRTRL